MSGWYVERLLLDSEIIYASIVDKEDYYGYEYGLNSNYDTDYDYNYNTGGSDYVYKTINIDFENDLYEDLLIVKSKMNELIKDGLIKKDELQIVDLILSNKSFSILEKENNISRKTLALKFKKLCAKIAYYLGGYFTDDGYLNYIKEKYKLTDEQINKARDFMNGNFRYSETRNYGKK